MILRPLLGLNLKPKLISLIKQTRSLRPTIKIGKERFELTIDVHQFNKDEVRVKARQDFVVIEGKQEREMKNGFVMRKFVRKFKLPPGCSPENIQSYLSTDGILTVVAKRKTCEINLPCETDIPITFTGPSEKEDEEFVKIEESENKCKPKEIEKATPQCPQSSKENKKK